MRFYLEPDSHVRDKVKVVLDLSNNVTKKNWIMLQALISGVDLAIKKDFII